MVELHLALELNCSPWNFPCRVPASGFVSGFQQKLFSHFQELKDKKALGCQYLKKTKQNLTACIERHLVWHNGWKVAPPHCKGCAISFPSKNAPYLMHLIRLQASERLRVLQCFVDLICQVKVFKDPANTGPPPARGLRG